MKKKLDSLFCAADDILLNDDFQTNNFHSYILSTFTNTVVDTFPLKINSYKKVA